VIDAAGKPPSGIMSLKAKWLGDWEQCQTIVPLTEDDMGLQYSPFGTKYCLASFPLGDVQVRNPLKSYS